MTSENLNSLLAYVGAGSGIFFFAMGIGFLVLATTLPGLSNADEFRYLVKATTCAVFSTAAFLVALLGNSKRRWYVN
jgi:hypothetical protein